MAMFEVTRGPRGDKASIVIWVEDAPCVLAAHIPGCTCVTGWRVNGVPKELQTEDTNYLRALREQKSLVVCTCIGRMVDDDGKV